MLEDSERLDAATDRLKLTIIVHLAAQAGVRYSHAHRRPHIESNIIGTFNVFETAHRASVQTVLMASSSSVYGGNEEMPFRKDQCADFQLTTYAAAKKAIESMAHAYAHLWNLPVTTFRLFTVYGPRGPSRS